MKPKSLGIIIALGLITGFSFSVLYSHNQLPDDFKTDNHELVLDDADYFNRFEREMGSENKTVYRGRFSGELNGWQGSGFYLSHGYSQDVPRNHTAEIFENGEKRTTEGFNTSTYDRGLVFLLGSDSELKRQEKIPNINLDLQIEAVNMYRDALHHAGEVENICFDQPIGIFRNGNLIAEKNITNTRNYEKIVVEDFTDPSILSQIVKPEKSAEFSVAMLDAPWCEEKITTVAIKEFYISS